MRYQGILCPHLCCGPKYGNVLEYIPRKISGHPRKKYFEKCWKYRNLPAPPAPSAFQIDKITVTGEFKARSLMKSSI